MRENLLSRISIKNKLWLLGGLIVCFTLVITGSNLFSLNKFKQQQDIKFQASELRSNLITLRQHEERYRQENNPQYTREFDLTLSSANDNLKTLINAFRNSNTGELASITVIKDHLQTCAEQFQLYTEIQNRIGLSPTSGLMGATHFSSIVLEKSLTKNLINKLMKDFLLLQRDEKNFLMRQNIKYIDRFNSHYKQMLGHIDGSSILNKKSKTTLIRQTTDYQEKFIKLTEAMLDRGIKNRKNSILYNMHIASGNLENDLDALVNTVKQSSTLTIDTISFIEISIALIVAIVGLLVISMIARSILQPIVTLSETMKAISKTKNMNLRAQVSGKNEISTMSNIYNTMMSEFQNILKEVSQSSQQLSQSSSDLTSITEKTNRGVNQQHSESDQVATAMNEMTATVREVARYANDAAEASKSANADSIEGKRVVTSTTESIQRLASEVESSSAAIANLREETNNIGSVLSVIQGIAEQTNLLALNAAIEAARAGESGRGFAVVADEVRHLAQRSQDSTQEIKTIIERLQAGAKIAFDTMEAGRTQANETVEMAGEAANSLDKISNSVAEISRMNTHIATAAEQQGSVSEEINKNINNITTISDETATHAHKTMETGSMLAGLSADLQKLISSFSLENSDSRLDLSTAKAAHLAWKARLRSFLNGEESLTLNEAVSHEHCVLGKWYYSEGLEKYGQLKPMQQLEPPHIDLHKLIHNIIQLKEAGEEDKAEEAFLKVEPLSTRIVELLEAVESAVSSNKV